MSSSPATVTCHRNARCWASAKPKPASRSDSNTFHTWSVSEHVRQPRRWAKLLLFGSTVDDRLTALAMKRDDIELIDLPRLYHGD